MEKIGELVSEKLDISPPKIEVKRHVRFKYACKCCEGLANEDEGAVKTAEMPPQMIEQGIVTEGLLSYIITAKFADALPFYRQSKTNSGSIQLPSHTSFLPICIWITAVALAIWLKN